MTYGTGKLAAVTKRPGRIEVYKASDGWRWRLLGGNGEIMLQGESHPSKSKVDRALRRSRFVFQTAILVHVMDDENGERVRLRQPRGEDTDTGRDARVRRIKRRITQRFRQRVLKAKKNKHG